MFANIGFILTIFVVIVLNELIKLYKPFVDRFPSISDDQAHEVRCRSVAICSSNEQENIFALFNDNYVNEKYFLTYKFIIY